MLLRLPRLPLEVVTTAMSRHITLPKPSLNAVKVLLMTDHLLLEDRLSTIVAISMLLTVYTTMHEVSIPAMMHHCNFGLG